MTTEKTDNKTFFQMDLPEAPAGVDRRAFLMRSAGRKGGLMLKSLITSVVFLAISTGVTRGADKNMILPKGAPPNAAWSYGILADGTLYVSGMGGENAAGKIPASFEDEVRQSFDNIGAVLKEAGMSSSDVVSVQVYLTDGALFNRMNTVYKAHFRDPKPARTTVVVAKLVGEGHVEITVTAKK